MWIIMDQKSTAMDGLNLLEFIRNGSKLRRPLLSIPKTEPRGRSGARLSTTRRSIQPKNKPLETLLDYEAHGDQKRSVTFTETQGPAAAPSAVDSPAEARRSSPASVKSPTLEVPTSASTVMADLHGPAILQAAPSISSKEKREQWGLRSSLSPPPSVSRPSTPTPPSRTCSPLPLSRTSSPLPPPLPVLSAAPAPGPPPPPPLPPVGASRLRESTPEDEDTAALLPRTDALRHLGDEGGMENPLLAPLLLSPPSPRRSPRRLPLPLSPVDLDLDESHV